MHIPPRCIKNNFYSGTLSDFKVFLYNDTTLMNSYLLQRKIILNKIKLNK